MVRYLSRLTDWKKHIVHLLYGVPTKNELSTAKTENTDNTCICAILLLFSIGVTTIHSQLDTDMMIRHDVKEQRKKVNRTEELFFVFPLVMSSLLQSGSYNKSC